MIKKTIIMIGPFPPPIGGVSIHTSRLLNYLEGRYNVYKIDTTKRRLIQLFRLLKLLIQSKFELSQFIIHNHGSRIEINSGILLLCRIFRIPYIQTIHSFRMEKVKLNDRRIYLIKYIINKSYKTIVVSNMIKNDLAKIEKNALRKVCVIPAFIPYCKKDFKITDNNYIDILRIKTFIESHKILLCANASKIVFYNNEDLYGIDLCIELMKKITDLTSYNIGFIFMLPTIGNEKYYNTLISRITEYGIEKDFIFINKDVDLVPLFEYVDVFLRPTNTDGDAISIREALYSGIPSIASDIVERPLGTITFKSRDTSDLYRKLLATLENIEEEKNRARKYGGLQENFIEEYLLIYDNYTAKDLDK